MRFVHIAVGVVLTAIVLLFKLRSLQSATASLLAVIPRGDLA